MITARPQYRRGRLSHLAVEYAAPPPKRRGPSLLALPLLLVFGAVYWTVRAFGGRR